MKICCDPWTDLSVVQVHQILQLRNQVFVVEQNCIYQDLDGKDILDGVYHLRMIHNEDLVGYARLLQENISFQNPSIGRIVISPLHRGKGLGEQLIAQCLKQAQILWPHQPLTIGAQSHLVALYKKFGFKEVSEHYDEDGIPHVDMTVIEPRYKEFL